MPKRLSEMNLTQKKTILDQTSVQRRTYTRIDTLQPGQVFSLFPPDEEYPLLFVEYLPEDQGWSKEYIQIWPDHLISRQCGPIGPRLWCKALGGDDTIFVVAGYPEDIVLTWTKLVNTNTTRRDLVNFIYRRNGMKASGQI